MSPWEVETGGSSIHVDSGLVSSWLPWATGDPVIKLTILKEKPGPVSLELELGTVVNTGN